MASLRYAAALPRRHAKADVDPTFPGLVAVAFAGRDPEELLSALEGAAEPSSEEWDDLPVA